MGYCIRCGQVCAEGQIYCTGCGRKTTDVSGSRKVPHTGILRKGILFLLLISFVIAACSFRYITDDRIALKGTWVCTDRRYSEETGDRVFFEFREDGMCAVSMEEEQKRLRFQYSLLKGSGIKAIRFVIADGVDAGQSYICRYRLDNNVLELWLDGFVRFERK